MHNKAGLVIGKGGVRLGEIEKMFKVNLLVDKAPTNGILNIEVRSNPRTDPDGLTRCREFLYKETRSDSHHQEEREKGRRQSRGGRNRRGGGGGGHRTVIFGN